MSANSEQSSVSAPGAHSCNIGSTHMPYRLISVWGEAAASCSTDDMSGSAQHSR